MAPPRRPKADKFDQETILAAAKQVFLREGLDGVNMRAIAAEANCNVSLIYYYYKNKESIFSALVDIRFVPMIKALRRLASLDDPRTTAEKLWEVIQIFRSNSYDSGFRGLVQHNLARVNGSYATILAPKRNKVQVAIRSIIRRGQRRGELRPDLPSILVTMFLLRMESEILDLVPSHAPNFTTTPPEEVVALAERAWFDVFWRGVAADPQAPLTFLPPYLPPNDLR